MEWLASVRCQGSIVRRALLGLYHLTAGGMPGNDDGGTMSAWWVPGSLGLYPARPGSDTLALSAPLFSRSVMQLTDGRLEVNAPGLSPSRHHIVHATLGGRAITISRLPFSRLVHGLHVLVLRMGNGRGWASRPG